MGSFCELQFFEVGTGYFDLVSTIISSGRSSTLAMHGSTEEEQFYGEHAEDLPLSRPAAALAMNGGKRSHGFETAEVLAQG